MPACFLFEAVVRAQQCRLAGAAISAALVCGAGRVEADYFIAYVVPLAISLAWFGEKKRLYFTIACVRVAVMAFVKFSASALVLSVLLAFTAIQIARGGRRDCGICGWRFPCRFFSPPVIWPTIHPSPP